MLTSGKMGGEGTLWWATCDGILSAIDADADNACPIPGCLVLLNIA